MTNLNDTSRCPRGVRCESCGTEHARLAVRTVRLDRLGVACMTLCPACAGSSELPRVGVGTAVRLTLQHCEHLGITADEAAAAMEED